VNPPRSMGRTALGGAFYVGAAQGVRVLLTIVSTVIVARILAPSDYGVVAMVAPVTAFLLLFQNLGLSHAAIQARTLSHDQSNALFWLNMAASGAIMLALLALSPVVAWFYDDPRPGYVTAASALTVLLSGSTIQHMALLNREFRFRTLSLIDMAGAAAAFAATIAAALLLRSYWALWLGTFVGIVVGMILVWTSSRWRPSRRITFRGSGRMVRFGGAITGFNLLNYLSRNVDNVLIGRFWGAGPLGLYDRSYRLMMFPLQHINAPLSRVMLPVLSRLRDEPERFRGSFLTTARAILLISSPAIAVVGASSEQLIPFLLGPRWSDAAPIFLWLSLTGLIQPLSNMTGWLFITSGRGRALMHWGLVSSILTVAAFGVGVFWGPVGVAMAYFVSSVAKVPILFAWCVRGTAVAARDLYGLALPSLGAAALIWLGVTWLLRQWSLIPVICLALPIAYVLALAVHWLSPGGRQGIASLAALVASARRRRSGDSAESGERG